MLQKYDISHGSERVNIAFDVGRMQASNTDWSRDCMGQH